MKNKPQRDLERAVWMLRKPGARLMLMHSNRPTEFATSGMRWFIVPGGPVEAEIAAKIIGRPDVYGDKDGLFPQHDQTWRFA